MPFCNIPTYGSINPGYAALEGCYSQIGCGTSPEARTAKFCPKIVEMSLSKNFPAQAEPSYEGSEPSQIKLGDFNVLTETELIILTICMSKNCKFLLLLKNYNLPNFRLVSPDFSLRAE